VEGPLEERGKDDGGHKTDGQPEAKKCHNSEFRVASRQTNEQLHTETGRMNSRLCARSSVSLRRESTAIFRQLSREISRWTPPGGAVREMGVALCRASGHKERS
jgi:hypothetical protein